MCLSGIGSGIIMFKILKIKLSLSQIKTQREIKNIKESSL